MLFPSGDHVAPLTSAPFGVSMVRVAPVIGSMSVRPTLPRVVSARARFALKSTSNPVLVRSGGPEILRQKLALLGHKSKSTEIVDVMLSSGVRLISKPSALNVPPWQLVSARLGGVPLRAATWWANPAIPSTSATTKIGCWSPSLGTPGPVQIATSGKWQGKPIDLRGGSGNHGKIGVSLTGRYTIFGDMNQQGALSGKCASSQNGRGGMFFILEDQALHDSVAALIDGNSAPVAPD